MLCVFEGDPHINKLFIICVFLRFNKHNLDYITKGFSGVTLCISSCVGWVGCHQLSSLFQLSDSLPQSELLIILLILQQLMHASRGLLSSWSLTETSDLMFAGCPRRKQTFKTNCSTFCFATVKSNSFWIIAGHGKHHQQTKFAYKTANTHTHTHKTVWSLKSKSELVCYQISQVSPPTGSSRDC